MCLAVSAALLLAFAGATLAQDADADQAKALLAQGIEQFNALDFKQAKATLLKVQPNDLSDAEKATLDDYLRKVDVAIRAQRADRETLQAAHESLRQNQFAEAIRGFQNAAESKYLTQPERDDAAANLVLARRKAEEANRLAQAAAAAEPVPEPAPVTAAPVVVETEPVAVESEPAVAEAQPMAVEIQPVAVETEPVAVESEPAVVEAQPMAVEIQPVAVETEPEPVTEVAANPEQPEVIAVEPAPTEPEAEAPAAAPHAEPVSAQAPAEASAMEKLQAERATKAAQFLQEGKTALNNNQIERAVELLGRAVALAPDNQEAKRLYEFARERMPVPSETGVLTRAERERRVAKQIADIEIAKRMQESREMLAAASRAADFDDATRLARTARLVLENNQNFYPPDEYRSKMLEIERYLRFIELQKQEWEAEQIRIQREEAERLEAERRAREAEERRRKIETLTERARQLRSDEQYREALDIVDQLLKLDPKNKWANEHREILWTFVILQDRKASDRAQLEEELKQKAEVEWKMVPWYDLLHFPRNWLEIRKRAERYGVGAGAESEANRAVRQKLQTIIPQLDFDEIPFKDVVDFLRNVSGASFYVNWKALTLQGIDRQTPVTVHLTKVSVAKALDVILRDVGGTNPLQYVVDEGVITVSTRDDLARQTVTRVYDVRHLLFTVPNFEGPRVDYSNYDSDDDDDNNGTSWASSFDTDDQDNEENIITKAEMINNLIDLIKETVDPPSWTTEAAVKEMHGQLVITQTPQNHQSIIDLLNQLKESRGISISVEARFIQVATGFLNSIGIDFDIYFNLGSTLGGGGVVTDPFTGGSVQTDGPSGWVGAGHSVPGNDSFTPSGVETGGGQRTLGFGGTMIGVATPVPSPIASALANPGLSVAGVWLDDVQVDFLLQATQAHQASRTLNAPRITLWNGQNAYVTVSTQTAYISGYDAVASTGEGGEPITVPVISFVPTGATLDVEATVTEDRKWVIMTVKPQVSSVTTPIPTVTTPAGDVGLPTVDIQDLQTTVMCPDGGTLLLGGQTIAGEVERELGVPLISKIPVINRLFTNRGKVRDQYTLLILIRPQIILHEEEEYRQFPE